MNNTRGVLRVIVILKNPPALHGPLSMWYPLYVMERTNTRKGQSTPNYNLSATMFDCGKLVFWMKLMTMTSHKPNTITAKQ